MKSLAVFSFALATIVIPARAQESKAAKIDKLMSLTNTQATLDQMFTQMKSMTASMAPAGSTPEQQAKAQEVMDKVMALLKTRLNWESLRPMYSKLYDSIFSEEEIDGMVAFYQTAAGRAMLQKMPQLMSRSIQLAQQQVGELMPEIQRIAREAAQK